MLAAVIILILAFGSVLAMGLPIGTALFGLGIGSALVSLGSNVISMPDFTTAMVAMIGLGVGIDYALFIVTRYREGLRLGLDVEESVVEAMDTSGRAVLFAGTTVIISLLGLCLMGLDFVQGVAIASSIGVLMMMLGSLTLLPALLGWVGTRIDNTTRAALIAVAVVVVATFVGVATGQAPIFFAGLLGAIIFFALSFVVKPLRKLVPHRAERPKEERFWYRWSRFIQHRPWPSALGAAGHPRAARAPAVRDPARIRRLRQLSRGQDRAPGVRPARRGLRPGHQRPALHRRRGRRGRRPGAARRVRRRRSQETENVNVVVPDSDQRRAGAGHRVPGQRAAGRRDRRPRRDASATT